jgi:hypothetical protein
MLTIEVLIEYPGPMDNCLPPQIYIREWREVELTPKEWYRVLASPVGCCFYKIKYWHE